MSKSTMLKAGEVEVLKDQLMAQYDITADGEAVSCTMKQIEDMVTCLEWAQNKLEQQKINSRSFLKKQSIKNRLLKEHLSVDELRSIDEQARRIAEDSLRK